MREMHRVARAAVCGVLVALSTGCHLPKLRFAEPGQPLPPDFNGAAGPDNSARLGVNDFFTDPLLTCKIAQALAGNQELKMLNEEVRIAANEVQARRGAYLPFVSLGARAGVDRHSLYTPEGAAEEQLLAPDDRRFPEPLPNLRLGANFLWQLDIWRELRNARDAAQQRYFAAIERRNYFVTRLVAEVAENYYELMALDERLEVLDQTIELQRQSLRVAEANKEAARGTELAVQRFQAEVRKNESERMIVRQEILEAENRINFLIGCFPQPVERAAGSFVDLDAPLLSVGVPAELLRNRRDVREAERELAAAGLDVKVARARFFPRLDLSASIGYEAFDPRYLFRPEALFANAAGDLVAPIINRKAIEADYRSANARQLRAVYDYQRTVLNAFTEVVNRVAKVENYRRSVEVKKEQLASLEASVQVASNLFQNARAEYVEVLLAQRDLLEARTVLIETKQQQLAAVVNAYQALGGGADLSASPILIPALPGAPAPEFRPGEEGLPPVPADQPPAPGDPQPAAEDQKGMARL